MCPDAFTIRELWLMMEGLQDQAWAINSSLLAMLHNLQCSKKSQMKAPNFFNPMLSKGGSKPLSKEETTIMLKQFLVAGTKGNYVEKKVKWTQNADGAWISEDQVKEK